MFAKDVLGRLWCILGSLHLTKDELLDLHPLIIIIEAHVPVRLESRANAVTGSVVCNVIHIAFNVVTQLIELVILSALERGFDVDEAFLEIVSALHQHDPQCV